MSCIDCVDCVRDKVRISVNEPCWKTKIRQMDGGVTDAAERYDLSSGLFAHRA